MALAERSNSVYAQRWRPLERALGTDGLEGLVRDDLQSAGEFVRQDRVYRTARSQLESFIVRRHLAAVPTNVLNRLLIQLISALPVGEPIDVALRRELSRDGRWPDDEQIREGIATVPYYWHGRPHQQRLVLQRFESHLRAEVDVDFDSASLSIEHIMPQTLSAEWKAELT